ncbi:MAG: hypothetical protein ABIH66_08535 [bacterium]
MAGSPGITRKSISPFSFSAVWALMLLSLFLQPQMAGATTCPSTGCPIVTGQPTDIWASDVNLGEMPAGNVL